MGPFQQFAFTTLYECAETELPLFSIISTDDNAGKRVDCERLLLPFGVDKVELILASLQLVSALGSFDRKTVITSFLAKSRISHGPIATLGLQNQKNVSAAPGRWRI